jgi:hypothetical protein
VGADRYRWVPGRSRRATRRLIGSIQPLGTCTTFSWLSVDERGRALGHAGTIGNNTSAGAENADSTDCPKATRNTTTRGMHRRRRRRAGPPCSVTYGPAPRGRRAGRVQIKRMDRPSREPIGGTRHPRVMRTARVLNSPSARLVPGIRGRGVGRIAAVALCLVAATGCQDAASSATAPQPAQRAAPAAMCGRVSELERLDVQRRDAFPQNRIRFSFPAHVVVASPRPVRAAAESLCRLRTFPAGTISCPADRGIVYHLTFQDRVDTYRVVVTATGCPRSAGDVGAPRWVTPQLWRTLGTAMGLPRPTRQSFAGSAT